MLRTIVSSPVNALLLAAPISWRWRGSRPLAVGVHHRRDLAGALAGLIGLGTEQLARRAGPAWGGFLNATFAMPRS